MSSLLRKQQTANSKQLTADASHAIYLVLPPEMGDEVEALIFPRSSSKAAAQQESLAVEH